MYQNVSVGLWKFKGNSYGPYSRRIDPGIPVGDDMRFFLIYIKMEVKRAIRYLPFLLLGIALLGILLGGGFFLGSRMLYGDEVSGRIQVAVVLPEDDPLAGKAMRMV